jgi:hypothetical protein
MAGRNRAEAVDQRLGALGVAAGASAGSGRWMGAGQGGGLTGEAALGLPAL